MRLLLHTLHLIHLVPHLLLRPLHILQLLLHLLLRTLRLVHSVQDLLLLVERRSSLSGIDVCHSSRDRTRRLEEPSAVVV
jgi:hypothetical protein